jgi:hypothetical protein
MPVWKFEDECLAPERRLRVDYTGPNPFKVCQVIRDMLIKIFHAGAPDLWERDFRWDTTADPRAFYMRTYCNKAVDQHTTMFIEITIQGEQPVDERKSGKVTIFVGGRLRTEYNLDTAFKNSPIYKAWRWLYNMYFYSEVRRRYLTMCGELISKLVDQLKEVYSLPKAV